MSMGYQSLETRARQPITATHFALLCAKSEPLSPGRRIVVDPALEPGFEIRLVQEDDSGVHRTTISVVQTEGSVRAILYLIDKVELLPAPDRKWLTWYRS